MARQFLRFLVVGGVKTVVTGLLFYVLAGVLPPRLAFTLVYIAGLLFVALVTPRFVFGMRASRREIALLLCWYAGIYFVGIAVVSGLDAISDSRVLLAVGTVLVTAPLGFAGARLLIWRPDVDARVPPQPD
jgi:putative flippase GtrA